MFLGVDTGGTFTDFVLCDGARLRIHKVLSTPHAPEEAILQGIRELGLDARSLYVVHGSTVATNAVLEGKGARTVFVTNRGMRDLLTIGRQTRPELYRLQQPPVAPPVPRERCLETGGRLGADGSVVEPLTEGDLAALRAALAAAAPEAVAINLLFSFLDERFERAVAAAVPDGVFVSRSSAVLPEYREYERGMATWLNAYVGPVVERYLKRLARDLPAGRVSVMQSSGGTIAAEQAGGQAVHMLLSGPAGGLAAARHVGAAAGRRRLLSLDMGGTSTDVALIDGALRLTGEGRIGPYPVAVPMVDMHTIGAGGGSIARLDRGGMLRVGPQSAGAAPGPACYGRGGRAPTVTDAQVVLGRLPPDAFLGGRMALDAAAARAAVGEIAVRLGATVEEAALGIVRIADEHMAQALRVISVQRGLDPRAFTLLSFGGAGGLHVCALAEALGMRAALVPVYAGVLSALGMLVAPRERQLARTIGGLLGETDDAAVAAHFERLAAEGRAALRAEGVAQHAITAAYTLDLRYRGQSYTLNVPWQGSVRSADAFHEAHRSRYGHRLDLPVEIVNARVAVRGPLPEIEVTHTGGAPGPAPHTVRLYGVAAPAALHVRAQLAPGTVIAGPALVTEAVATTYIAPGWECRVDGRGNLLLGKE